MGAAAAGGGAGGDWAPIIEKDVDGPASLPLKIDAEHPYTKEPGNAAETAARAILESRGNAPRLYRNTLVFLAADKVRLQDLGEAVRRFLAWRSILDEKDALNLDRHQVRQAETQRQAADGAVTARLSETYQWLLAPEQARPDAPAARIVPHRSGRSSTGCSRPAARPPPSRPSPRASTRSPVDTEADSSTHRPRRRARPSPVTRRTRGHGNGAPPPQAPGR
jgi:hypothetical protein